MTEITTKSGATAVINIAPWQETKKLKKAIQNELARVGSNIKLEDDAIAAIKALCSVDGSDSFDEALWPCLARCLYKGEKITESLFDSPDARKDYYELVFACVQENLASLMAGLFLQLSPILKSQAGNILRSKSVMNASSSPSA